MTIIVYVDDEIIFNPSNILIDEEGCLIFLFDGNSKYTKETSRHTSEKMLNEFKISLDVARIDNGLVIHDFNKYDDNEEYKNELDIVKEELHIAIEANKELKTRNKEIMDLVKKHTKHGLSLKDSGMLQLEGILSHSDKKEGALSL